MKPNLFIIGAPKCGTTSLWTYLSQHPDMYLSRVKEPHYFAKDMYPGRGPKTLQEYLSLFTDCSGREKYIGEASVFYLHSGSAIERILSFNPNARFIAMVRNPIDMAISYHAELLKNITEEDEQSFERAWRLQNERKNGKNLPFGGKCNPNVLQYKSIVSLGSQVSRFFQIVPASQRMVLVFDDFAANTQDCYSQVLKFLDVSTEHRPEFEVRNARVEVRWKWLGLVLKRKPDSIVKAYLKGKDLLGFKGFAINKKLSAFNFPAAHDKERISPSFRAQVASELQEEIDLLGRLLDRDFRNWI